MKLVEVAGKVIVLVIRFPAGHVNVVGRVRKLVSCVCVGEAYLPLSAVVEYREEKDEYLFESGTEQTRQRQRSMGL
jgi:hypothetical protein